MPVKPAPNCARLPFHNPMGQRNTSLSGNRQFEPIRKICYVLEMNVIIAETGTKRRERKGLTVGGGSGLKVLNKVMKS